MMEAGLLARRVAHQLGRSDCVVREVLGPVDREMSFTQRLGSGHPRQTSRGENHRIIAPSLGTPVSSRTLRRRLGKGHFGLQRPLRVLPFEPIYRRHHLEWCRSRRNGTAAEWNHVVFSDEFRFNLSSNDNRVRVWILRGERLNPAFSLQRHTTPTAGVMTLDRGCEGSRTRRTEREELRGPLKERGTESAKQPLEKRGLGR
ncbi:transposable element Tcb2 transposase [Trichonephila clavipes]|nr:transposable element Tcb2 transposase [Trichonephila clavipes]